MSGTNFKISADQSFLWDVLALEGKIMGSCVVSAQTFQIFARFL